MEKKNEYKREKTSVRFSSTIEQRLTKSKVSEKPHHKPIEVPLEPAPEIKFPKGMIQEDLEEFVNANFEENAAGLKEAIWVLYKQHNKIQVEKYDYRKKSKTPEVQERESKRSKETFKYLKKVNLNIKQVEEDINKITYNRKNPQACLHKQNRYHPYWVEVKQEHHEAAKAYQMETRSKKRNSNK